MQLISLPIVVFLVAGLYSSVGFGGASSYLAVMSLYEISPALASSLALTLNILVASMGVINYSRNGHFRWELIWPFLVTSIPAAFLGGMITMDATVYGIILNVILTYVAINMFLKPKLASLPNDDVKLPKIWLMLVAGGLLGFISGMIGIGGGIFLSPLIILAKWGSAKQAAASSAVFIVINSISGLVGRALSGGLQYGEGSAILIAAGVVGGFLGSYIGAKYLSHRFVQILLGVVLLVVVGRNLWG